MENKELVFYRIYEELIQSASEANLGRELTEQELKRIPCAFMENERAFGLIYEAIIEVAEEAMKEEGWEEYDKMYKDIPLEDIV